MDVNSLIVQFEKETVKLSLERKYTHVNSVTLPFHEVKFEGAYEKIYSSEVFLPLQQSCIGLDRFNIEEKLYVEHMGLLNESQF